LEWPLKPGALCLENLSILSLARTKLAKAKSTLDAAFAETLQWKYKSLQNNVPAIQQIRFFPQLGCAQNAGTRTTSSVSRIGSDIAQGVELIKKGT
jgi:hypothetical protein